MNQPPPLRDQGFSAHERGDLAAAESAYREALGAAPDDFEVEHALGVLELQTGRCAAAAERLARVSQRRESATLHADLGGALCALARFDEALRHFDRALAADGSLASAHLNKAYALQCLGRHLQALESYDRAIALLPSHAGAQVNRGVALRQLGRLQEAAAAHAAALALEPQNFEARLNRAAVWCDLARFADALGDADRAVQLRPERPEGHLRRAAILAASQRPADALAAYDDALARGGDCAPAHQGRAAMLFELGQIVDALAAYECAIGSGAADAAVHVGRGLALQGLARLDAALASFDQALAIDPRSAMAHYGRANLLLQLKRFEEALHGFDRALAIDPGYVPAHLNRGTLLHDLSAGLNSCGADSPGSAAASPAARNLAAAIASYDAALARQPDYAEAHYNRGTAHLALGDFERGWSGFEWRWAVGKGGLAREKRSFPQARWSGAEPLERRTIFVHSEQGLGDTVQFCRYATLLAERGARVILEVQAPLRGLLASLAGVAEWVVPGEALPHFDYWTPLLSLPLALRTTPATIPTRIPYLSSDAQKRRAWAELLGPKRLPRVGLVWSGGVRHDQPELARLNERRNIPLAKLAPLARAEVEFFSLQKGQPAESELALALMQGWDGPRMQDHTHRLHDFAETAALLEALDLLISVDTSTAHVAAALGKPVWLLNRYDTCWRWFLERDDSPWYPTMRLYRQSSPGDWDGVIAAVLRDLRAERFLDAAPADE